MKPLGQIEKRLQIIKTAISLTDVETINMQCSKLRLYKNDKQLENILSVIDDENYVQATNLIDRYLHGPYDKEKSPKEVTEKEENDTDTDSTKIEEPAIKKVTKSTPHHGEEEAELIKKFGLFMEEASREEFNPVEEIEREIQLKPNEEEPKTVPSEEEELTQPPSQPSPEDIIASYESIDEEKIPVSDTMHRSPLDRYNHKEALTEMEEKSSTVEQEDDLSFEINETSLSGSGITHRNETPEESEAAEEEDEEKEAVFPIIEPAESTETVEMETVEPEEEEVEKKEADIYKESDKSENTEESEDTEPADTTEYPPISYIDQKFRNMRNQYPQVEESTERFESEERLLYLISLEGYTEADIEEAIDKVYALKKEGKLAEAAHLLLIAAATESLYAQFILARELYNGDILQKDLPEAFTQINRLAMLDYPEAVCDLAQFYEFGIGIDKDKRKAFSLYEDALDLGVKRAESHLTRMEEASKSFFTKLIEKLTKH